MNHHYDGYPKMMTRAAQAMALAGLARLGQPVTGPALVTALTGLGQARFWRLGRQRARSYRAGLRPLVLAPALGEAAV